MQRKTRRCLPHPNMASPIPGTTMPKNLSTATQARYVGANWLRQCTKVIHSVDTITEAAQHWLPVTVDKEPRERAAGQRKSTPNAKHR